MQYLKKELKGILEKDICMKCLNVFTVNPKNAQKIAQKFIQKAA